jgi:hypothetical protein
LDASREMESKLNFMLGILLMWLSIWQEQEDKN